MRAALLALLLPAVVFAATDLTFKNRGIPVKTITLEQITNLLPPKEIKVYEPHEQHDQGYRAVPFNALLDAIYGAEWKKSEEILFTCVDNYQPSLPTTRFLQYSSFLALERVGSKEFRLTNRLHHDEKVDLGPYYLVWDNLGAPILKADGAEGWPYQVTTIDLIRFADRFPDMAPRENASSAAKRGFVAFRKHCIACHRVNGEGGGKGFELNYPVSVTEYFNKPWLRKWITDPSSMRYGTAMPSFNRPDKGWSETLDDIIAYLEAMAKNKRKPVPAKG